MPRSYEKQKRELIDGLVNARRSNMEAVQALPGDCLDEIFLGSWSVKDLIAHLIGWDYTNLQAIQEIISNQVPSFLRYSDKDWQSYNRTLVARHRVEPFTSLLAAAEQSHLELVSYLDTLAPEVVVLGKAKQERGRSITIRNLLRVEARDECKHAGQIMEYFHPGGGRPSGG